jgi:hypothetical protein
VLRSSRVTSFEGDAIASCNPLGACRFIAEDCAFSQITLRRTNNDGGALLHMCTGHSMALRRTTARAPLPLLILHAWARDVTLHMDSYNSFVWSVVVGHR